MKMNKILAVLLAVVLLAAAIPVCLAPSVSAAVGEITNGGFETGDFTGWEYYSYASSINSSYKKSGSYSCKIGKDSSLAGHVALEQIVPVNTNATYTLSFYNRNTWSISSRSSTFTVSVELGTTPSSFTGTGLSASTPSVSTSFTQRSYSFSTGSYKYARIRFNARGTGGTDNYVDDIALTATNEGDTGTHAAPSFLAFSEAANRPNSSSNNVVTQPSFESTTDAEWNVDTFITGNLSVASDPDAKDGSKVLYYNNDTSTESWHTFDLSLPSGGYYVLSAWLKTPFLSATNQGEASFGLIDPDTGLFFTSILARYKGHTSTPWKQMRSTSTDNQWHLRAIKFYVGGAATIKIGVYGKLSEMYIDDISVHLLENGVTYVGDQTGTISPSNNSSNMYCESEDNLIVDCNMGPNAKDFWSFAASGWNNGFMSFDTLTDTHGGVLKFTGTGASGNGCYNYVKWIDVEPNTQYTVSFDYRVLTAGSGMMRFIDNNIDLPVLFKTYSFGTATNWTTTSFTFNPGAYNRVGIVFTDGGGTAYFDDFRIFKTSAGISTEPEEEVFPSLKPLHPEKGVSRTEENAMDLNSGNGLAFKFTLESSGLTIDTDTPYYKDGRNTIDYTNGIVDAFENGGSYKLITAGAVMTNQESVGQDEDAFTLDGLNSNLVIDVPAVKAWEEPTDILTYVVRIINIPDAHKETLIYARPYYIFEYNGNQVTMYGDIQFESYTPQKDINDGWLEWD